MEGLNRWRVRYLPASRPKIWLCCIWCGPTGHVIPGPARMSSQPRGRMEVLESRTIAPKASLHLVAIGDRRLVIGLTPSGMVSIAELDAAEFESETNSASAAEEDANSATAAGTGSATARPSIGASPWPAGTVLGSLLAPLDGLTGRLATFLGGGRVR